MSRDYKKLTLIFVAVLAIIIVPAHFAHASWIDFADLSLSAVYSLISMLLQLIFTITGWFMAVTGGLMNISINMTLHIKDLVTGTQGVYLVWQAIRDVSSLFIIFLLLYTSFRIILGLDEKIGTLIKNIVIAGILINFSFFLTGLLIDASNVVSLAIYNAITPAATQCKLDNNFNNCSSLKINEPKTYDGGLSALITESMKVTAILNPKMANLDLSKNDMSATKAQGQIIFMQVAAIVIMATTGLSFAVAAIAFIVRLVMLIFILAFSPIWFASWIFPQLKGLSDMFTKNLYKQLVFMPAYLFLLYAALRVVTTMNLGDVSKLTGDISVSGIIIILVNYTIVAIMLNLPLMAAVSIGGISGKWMDKFGAGAAWKKVGAWAGGAAKWTGSQAGSRTLGRAAYALNDSMAMKKFASMTPLGGKLASSGLSSVSKSGFGEKKGGYEDRLKAKKKANEDLHKRIGSVERANYATKEEFDKAETEAKALQAKYRTGLPWGRKNVIGFMIDNRANREAQSKLNKDADKQAKKDRAKKDRKELDELNKEEKALKEESSIIVTGSLGEEIRRNKEKRLAEISKRKEEIQTEIEAANEVIAEEKDQKIMSKLEEIEKKSGEQKP